MGYGDEIVAAGQAQRAYDADPSRRVAIVGVDGAPRWHEMWDGNPIIARPEDVAAGEPVQRVVNGPHARPYIVYPFTKESGWTFSPSFRCRDHRARLYLTEAERARGTAARARHGAYVLIEPFTKHENFRWPLHLWHELVAACPDLVFVQHLHRDSVRVLGAQYEIASFRDACGLLTTARAYVRSESGLCHAAAALERRQVTLFGGCMDANVMGGYPRQHVIADDDPATPCGAWLPCRHCAAAMARITVARVVAALRAALAEEGDNHGPGEFRTGEKTSPDHGRREQRRYRSEAESGERDRSEVVRDTRGRGGVGRRNNHGTGKFGGGDADRVDRSL